MSATGEKFVSAIEGTKDVVISTEAVNRILQGEASNIVDCWGFLLRNKGHLLYVLNLPYQARTLVFDMHTKMWHEWEWNDGASDTNFPMIDACEFVDQLHYLHVADGYIYKSSPDIYDDNGNPLRMLVQTSQYDGDSAKVKFFSRIEILADHVSDPSEMTVSWSDDDYKTWSTPRAVDLSGRAYLYRCGSSRRRAFRLYSDADTAIRLNAMEFELTVGTH
jgi:hypothetical protein